MKSRTLDPERLTKPIRERMDTSQFALPKPGPRPKAQPKDGRLIERGSTYSRTKRAIWERQGKRCADCGKHLPTPAFGERHHLNGRGLGGSKRSDAVEDSVVLCKGPNGCHERRHPGPQWSGKKADE